MRPATLCAINQHMTWRDFLTEKETADLERLERIRDDARDAVNALRLKLKSRAESRMRQRAKDARDGKG